jgi:hypothetical integral membrane protein (TIGR02206 family)
MGSVPRFVLFGPAHVLALLAAGGAAALLARLVRHGESASQAVRIALAAVLLGATAAYLLAVYRAGRLEVWDLVPLHLCDFLIFVAVFALLARHQGATELLYFWACTGTLLAMVTPDLRQGFPDWRFFSYFLLHGAVVAAAVVLVFGLGLRPRPGAAWRAFLVTNAYAAAVYAVDAVFDQNFLYLRGKPRAATLLDWMGPWPVYILVVDAVALGLFVLLEQPFRRGLRPVEPSR